MIHLYDQTGIALRRLPLRAEEAAVAFPAVTYEDSVAWLEKVQAHTLTRL